VPVLLVQRPQSPPQLPGSLSHTPVARQYSHQAASHLPLHQLLLARSARETGTVRASCVFASGPACSSKRGTVRIADGCKRTCMPGLFGAAERTSGLGTQKTRIMSSRMHWRRHWACKKSSCRTRCKGHHAIRCHVPRKKCVSGVLGREIVRAQ